MAAAQAPPDVVSFSSSISVSEAAGFWELALQLLNTLEISGRVPDLFSFNSAISACEKGGQLDLALKLKNCLLQQGRLSPDVLTFSSLISAAAKDRHWCTALKSLEEMDLGRVAPSLITYNSLISACGETFLGWAMALSFLNAAQLAGCRPDVITHSSSISSCHRATHWPHALTLMEQGNIISCEMLINACTADGAALGHVPRFLCTADRLGRSLCQRSLKGH
ncbi:Pentatricopeptide repeat-containing protein At1g09900 [Durusdinium trenchii]